MEDECAEATTGGSGASGLSEWTVGPVGDRVTWRMQRSGRASLGQCVSVCATDGSNGRDSMNGLSGRSEQGQWWMQRR